MTPISTAAQATEAKRRKTGHPHTRRNLFILLCTVPTFLLYTFFVVYPVFDMFALSLRAWSGFGDKTFVGLDNFTTLMRDEVFWRAFLNTIILILVVTLITIVLALYTAAVLAKGNMRGKAFFRIVFYVPNILSIVVISAIFTALYSPEYGILKAIVELFKGTYTGLLTNKNTVLPAIAIAMIWQAVGYYMVMYIAGMDSIPDSLYESAGLDGATKMRQFFVITLPLTWQVIRVTLTFFVISTINMSFLFITAMADTSYNSPIHVLLTYMFERKTEGFYGYSMAIGSVLFVFAYGISLLINRLTRREVVEV